MSNLARRLLTFAVNRRRGMHPDTLKKHQNKSHRYNHLADLYSQKYRDHQSIAKSFTGQKQQYHLKLAKLYYRLASAYRQLDSFGGTNEATPRKIIDKIIQQIHNLDPDIKLSSLAGKITVAGDNTNWWSDLSQQQQAHYLASHPNSKLSVIPPPMGTTAIPPGQMRRFHVTDPNDVASVKSEGLTLRHARGIEGPKAIYSWTNAKDAKQYAGGSGAIVEFHHDPKNYDAHPYATTTEVPTDNILGIHLPWHHMYHYVKQHAVPFKNVERARNAGDAYAKIYQQILAERTESPKAEQDEAPTASATAANYNEDEYDDDPDDKFQHLPTSSILKNLRTHLANIAQQQYDQWQQNDEGEDDELGHGGICHLIADDMVSYLWEKQIPCTSVSDSMEVHVYVVAQCSDGIFEVNIPARVYETGGGYTWKKIAKVKFDAGDVIISKIDGSPSNMRNYVEE